MRASRKNKNFTPVQPIEGRFVISQEQEAILKKFDDQFKNGAKTISLINHSNTNEICETLSEALENGVIIDVRGVEDSGGTEEDVKESPPLEDAQSISEVDSTHLIEKDEVSGEDSKTEKNSTENVLKKTQKGTSKTSKTSAKKQTKAKKTKATVGAGKRKNSKSAKKVKKNSKKIVENSLPTAEEIEEFLKVNSERGLSRAEIMDYLKVTSFKKAKAIIDEKKISLNLESIVVDLRRTKLVGTPIFPNKLEKNALAIKNDVVSTETAKSDNQTNLKENTTKSEEQKAEAIKFPISEDTPKVEIEPIKEENASAVKECENAISIKESFFRTKKIRNYIVDTSIFDMRIDSFLKLLNQTIRDDEIPVFNLYENDLLYYDDIKNTNEFARDFIKFFAQDDERKFSRLIKANRPEGEKLAKLCKANNITLISADTANILEAKLNKVNVIIPSFFKDKFPNPCSGNMVYGMDSNLGFTDVPLSDIKAILRGCKKIVISDIQYREIKNKNSYFLKVVAYYGEIYKATTAEVDMRPDQKIINFYKIHEVDLLLTMDSCFKVSALMQGLNCKLVENINHINPSRILDTIKKAVQKEAKRITTSESDDSEFVKLKMFKQSSDGKCMEFLKGQKDYSVSVFENKKNKRSSDLTVVRIFTNDVVCIKKEDTVTICLITDCKNQMGKVLYCGEVKEVPSKYARYLT